MIELAHPPATHVWTDGKTMVTRIDALTLEQARVVIVRLCDDLVTTREALADALKQSLPTAGEIL